MEIDNVKYGDICLIQYISNPKFLNQSEHFHPILFLKSEVIWR